MKENRDKITFEFNRKNTKGILLIITFTLILYHALRNFNVTLSFLGNILSVFSPFVIGLCVAFILNVALRPIENLWDKLFKKGRGEKLKRPLCLLVSVLLVIGIILAVFLVVIPEFKDTLISFTEALPYNIAKTEKWFSQFLKNVNLNEMGLSPAEITEAVKNTLSMYGKGFINKTFDVTSSLVSGIAKMVIGIILSIYMLSQKETLIRQLKKLLFVFVKKENAELCIRFSRIINKTFTNFVTGQLTEAVIIGFLCFIGMFVLRLPYAPVISVLVGFTALIPVFGAFFGTAIGAFLILLTSPIKALWFVIFILVLQQLEGNLIYPKVVGKSVGLPGIWVLAAVTVGGSLFGFVGMLICVPVCSVLYSLLKIYVNIKTKES